MAAFTYTAASSVTAAGREAHIFAKNNTYDRDKKQTLLLSLLKQHTNMTTTIAATLQTSVIINSIAVTSSQN